MKHLIFISSFLILLFISFLSCDNPPNIISTPLEKSKPIDWTDTLQKATSFKEETELLKSVIRIDSTNQYEQLIANRLQTFDLRHLSEAEKLTIIDLYAASLVPSKNPAQHILQTASAKLNAVYPTNNTLIDKRLLVLIHQLKN